MREHLFNLTSSHAPFHTLILTRSRHIWHDPFVFWCVSTLIIPFVIYNEFYFFLEFIFVSQLPTQTFTFFWGRNICMHLCRGHNMHECKGINVKAWSSENILIYRLYGQRVNNTIEILVVVWWCQISKSFLLMANFSQGRLKIRISARMQWPPMQNTNRASDWLYRRRPVGWMVGLT